MPVKWKPWIATWAIIHTYMTRGQDGPLNLLMGCPAGSC